MTMQHRILEILTVYGSRESRFVCDQMPDARDKSVMAAIGVLEVEGCVSGVKQQGTRAKLWSITEKGMYRIRAGGRVRQEVRERPDGFGAGIGRVRTVFELAGAT